MLYVFTARKIKIYQKFLNIKKSNEVILATDDEKEKLLLGIFVKYLIYQVEKTSIIVFHQLTKSAILNAVKNYRYIDMNKVNSQQARAVLDILVGYTISP